MLKQFEDLLIQLIWVDEDEKVDVLKQCEDFVSTLKDTDTLYAITNLTSRLEDNVPLNLRDMHEGIFRKASEALETFCLDKRGTPLTLVARRALAYISSGDKYTIEEIQDVCYGHADKAIKELLDYDCICEIHQNPAFGKFPPKYQIYRRGHEMVLSVV